MSNNKAQLALDRAKVGLMTDKGSVFVTTILFSLDVRFDDRVPTAGTNGVKMFINTDWFLTLTPAQQVGLLVHEVWHVALSHMLRGIDKDKQKYNIAGDHVINLMITDSGMQIPDGGHCDPQYRGLSTMEVYDKLPDPPCSPQGGGGMDGDVIYEDFAPDSPEAAQMEMEITNTLIKAKTQSEISGEDPGNMPAEFQRLINDLINPVLPWQQLLANYMSNFQKDDYSYKRINRRFMPDFIMPTQYSERLADIGVAIDLSGSITDEQLVAFLSELKYIQDTMKPERMVIIGFDTELHEIHEIAEGDNIMDLKFTGGGGTDIDPVVEFFNKRMPVATIIFTDMYFDDPSDTIEFSHLWVVIDNPDCIPETGDYAHYNF